MADLAPPASSASNPNPNPTAVPIDLTDHVKLVSADGFEFVLDRRCAMASGTIKAMLSSPARFAESHHNVIEFKDIKAVVLEKVCQYLHYKVRYTNSSVEIPEFDMGPPEIYLELLMAADFLDC
ncbi:BTB/POZ protein [Catenaria anguillulae PL171]|uniref:Elongin-C n=1 Tax=Catenaria anguillulae PL171 TaxID=765915 RepID=A0A1Y2HMY0_9FUNG|nr:BTB/POZ protein [Catenaria anguillulae PL171]